MKDLSVVIPVYNSASHVHLTIERLESALIKTGFSFEIILINDGSSDNSWKVIDAISQVNSHVVAIELMRNFGQDNAIMAGLHVATGGQIIIMDDDLQHDPNDIPLLINEINLDYDVVYANFREKQHSLIKNLGSWFNGKVANIVIGKPEAIYLSPFKIFTAKVKDELIKYEGPYPYVDGLIFRITRNIGQITVDHHERKIGVSNYNLWKSFKVWLNLATSFSVIPLRASVLLGFIASILAFIMAAIFVVQYCLNERGPSGWASLIVTVLFFSGTQLIAIGFAGEYIGRTYLHLNRNPQSIVRKISRINEAIR